MHVAMHGLVHSLTCLAQVFLQFWHSNCVCCGSSCLACLVSGRQVTTTRRSQGLRSGPHTWRANWSLMIRRLTWTNYGINSALAIGLDQKAIYINSENDFSSRKIQGTYLFNKYVPNPNINLNAATSKEISLELVFCIGDSLKSDIQHF